MNEDFAALQARVRSHYVETPPVDQEQLQRELPPPFSVILWGTRRAPMNRPSRPGRGRTISRSAHGSRRANRTRGPDDGSDSELPEPPPPAEPHGRGDEHDRGTFTSRPRTTGGDLVGAYELVLREIEHLVQAAER